VDVAGTVQALFAAFSVRDADALVALCTEDISFWPQGTAEELGRAAPYEGRDGIRRYFADLDQAWTTLTVHADSTRIAGQGVIAFGRARGTTKSGRDIDVPVIWVMKLRDGRVASVKAVTTAEEARRVARG
jgi:ketosteroid isomerase-like protein